MSSRPPARRGMSLNAKIGVAVAALVALVFAVTMFSQLTRPADDIGGGGGGAAETPKSGLSVDVNFLRFDPAHPRAEYRDYPQFFEAGEHTVSFWASNPNEVPLTVSFGHTSCAQCSLAEFAVVSAPPLTGDTDPNPFAAVMGGVIGRPAIDPKEDPPFGLNALAHRARKAMEAAVPPGGWQRLVPANSARPDAGEVKPSVTVPAATSPDQPTWVVIRLNIKLSSTKTLETRFDCTRPDSPTPLPLPLATSLTLAEPCDVFPPVIDFKTLPEGVRSAEEVVYFWSATRTLPPSADPL
nr:hypothetical protein [Fimbriiglobus sp.]